MRITVRLFARLRDLAGSPEVVRDVPAGATVETVWQAVAAEFPAIAPYRASVSAAANADYVKFSAPVADGDEVAFLPPVSGG
jgi:molybdopterin converting factor subunit 1